MLDLALRWIHVLSAAVLVGGTFFLRFSLFPALASLPEDARQSFQEAWRGRWARLVMITSGLLLLSGLLNAVRNIIRYEFPGGMYHGLVAVKLLLALAFFWVSALLAGRSPMAEKCRARSGIWLNIALALAIALVCVGGYMRSLPRTEKSRSRSSPRAPPISTARSKVVRSGSLDKKAKKRIEVLRQRLQKLQQQLSGAKQQPDEPGEVERLQAEIDKLRIEIDKLRAS